MAITDLKKKDDPVAFTRGLTDSSSALKAVSGLAAPARPAASSAPAAKPASGGFARTLFDASAALQDATKAPFKGAADLANRGAVGVRNLVREGVGLQPVQPYQFNYHATRDQLAEIRAANAQPRAQGATATPAATATAAATIPARRPSFANVRGSSRTAPGPISGSGMTGGGAGPARAGYRTLASGVGAAGEPVYDNASIARLQERLAQPGAGGTTRGLTPVQAAGSAAPAVLRALPAIEAQQPQAATLSLPRRLSGDLAGAEQERKNLLGDIDTEIMRLGTLNSRGKRQLFADLQGQRVGLTGKRIDQVTGLETQGAQLDAAAATEAAQLQQQAALRNADRAFGADQANLDVQLRQQEMDATNNRVSRTLVDRDGNTSVLTEGGQLRQLTGADGQPFREQEDPSLLRAQTVSPDAEFKALSDRLAQLQQFGRPQDAAEAKQYDTDVSQLQARMNQLTGAAPAQGGKQVKRTGTLNGRRVVEYTDGTTAYLD